jgi:hypothetical protein
MLELPNITLTSFLVAFFIGFALSIMQKSYASALGCALTIGSILPIKYMAWKKAQKNENKKQKVIVIKRK